MIVSKLLGSEYFATVPDISLVIVKIQIDIPIDGHSLIDYSSFVVIFTGLLLLEMKQ